MNVEPEQGLRTHQTWHALQSYILEALVVPLLENLSQFSQCYRIEEIARLNAEAALCESLARPSLSGG